MNAKLSQHIKYWGTDQTVPFQFYDHEVAHIHAFIALQVVETKGGVNGEAFRFPFVH